MFALTPDFEPHSLLFFVRAAILPMVSLLPCYFSSGNTKVPLYSGDHAAFYFGTKNVYIFGKCLEEPRGRSGGNPKYRSFTQKKLLQIDTPPCEKQPEARSAATG